MVGRFGVESHCSFARELKKTFDCLFKCLLLICRFKNLVKFLKNNADITIASQRKPFCLDLFRHLSTNIIVL